MQLNTFNTPVTILEEDGMAVFSVKGINILCIPIKAFPAWMNTTAAHRVISNKIERLGMVRTKAKSFRDIAVGIMDEAYGSDNRAKTFINTSTGEEVTVRNMAKFCRERCMSYEAFKQMARGTTQTSQGWKLKTQ